MQLDDFPGYALGRQIYGSASSAVFRATLLEEKRPVILKALRPECPRPEERTRYRQEYEITRQLDSAGIIRAYGLNAHRGALVLVLEDFGGKSLDLWLKDWSSVETGGVALPLFFDLARQMVEALSQVHDAGITHKNIAPSNIVFNADSGQLKLIDFGFATTLHQEIPTPKTSQVLEGTPTYLSPEQTGRMNRSVDYRSDFYSLGVAFYELLTGRLPFEAVDVMEWVHCHLARTPVAPHLLNPGVPVALSELVQKMMAKAPEDRYQSARGLRHDLQVCEQHWRASREVPGFQLGTQDRTDRFLIPERLYGRAAEVESLLAAFERAANGHTELLLVTGFSGIGKTAVINQAHKPIVQRRGYFIRGKFDQFGRAIPFSAFWQALRDLIEQLLSESEARQQRWRSRILSALGESGQVMVDVVPELESIIGPQPSAPDLPGGASQNRFNLLFQRLIAAFAAAEHPLVIFLDDLQWADLASLKLLQLLMNEASAAHLLVLGAFRDNEVSATHPLRSTLEDIQRTGAALSILTLAPLARSHIDQLVADTLGCALDRASPLTQLIYQKTKGNPFFSRQFLKSLHADGLITAEAETGHWQCDLAHVSALALTDDVLEFMVNQLQKLPGATGEVLRLAACIGGQFDLATLAIVCQEGPATTAADLWPAVRQGLVLPQSHVHSFFSEGKGDLSLPPLAEEDYRSVSYKFLHDRVQQAAYSLIPDAQKLSTHLRIGQLLLQNTPEAERDGKIFEIVGQFNRGAELLTEPAARREVAELNLMAGRKAKAATAFRAAWDYFTAARQMLPDSSWEDQYDLTLELYGFTVEAAYLTGDFETMAELASIVLAKARSPFDTIKVHEVTLEALAIQNKTLEAVNAGLGVLGTWGVEFPKEPSQADIIAALQETREAYQTHEVAGLIGMPLMTDPARLAVMRILAGMLAPAFLSSPELYALLVMKQVHLSVKYGNTPASAFAYASYGLLLSGPFEDIESGHQFGQLALELVHRLDAREWQCKVPSVVHTFITHWKNSVRDTLMPLRSAYHAGLEVGDFQFAGYSALLACAYAYFAGVEQRLPELERETSSLSESIRQLGQMTMYRYFQVLRQALHDMREGRASLQHLQGEYFDEERMLPELERTRDWNCIYYIHLHKLIVDYHLGAYRQAVDDACRMLPYNENARSFPYEPISRLYDSLARLAVQREDPQSNPQELVSRIDAHQEKLKAWSRFAPMNWLHKVDLIEAERQRTFGAKTEAMEAYDRAIMGAKSNGYWREEALANELAAEFYLDWGREKVAQAYLQEAYAGYVRWGADAKAAQLASRYPELLAPVEGPHAPRVSAVNAPLDLVTVIKASQAISGEIELEPLLKQMMRIVIENAGAERGALLLERGGDWVIEAQGTAEGPIEVGKASRLDDSSSLSAGIVRQVIRTRTSVLLDDAAREGAFVGDPYVAERALKSVLCAPLINHGVLSGLVYLENNLTTHAFTAQRWELLNLLSTHMALSLDNARLYEQAQQELREKESVEAALRRSEEKFRTIFDSFNDAIFIHDPVSGVILDVNQTMIAMYGYRGEEVLRLDTAALSLGDPPYSQQDAMAWLKRAAEDGPQVFEWRARDVAGRLFWVEVNVRRATIGGEDRMLVAVRDISERKQAEEERLKLESQLIQAQKMESVGRLAGGIAHDFNNMLTVVLGFAELMKNELSIEDPIYSSALGIERAALHSRDITNQLLAFSRKQIIAPKLVVLNDLVAGMQKTLLQLIGEDIDLRFLPTRNLWKTRVDPTQIGQLLINLAVNARDAMPLGGALTIETANLSVSEEFCRDHLDFKPGQYVAMIMSDSGIGMDQDTVSHIFEPFFTTKEVGKGTGLGLATAYGIVKQNGGVINVYSEPGRGTTFKIYFERYLGEDTRAGDSAESPAFAPDSGTVLLVEDNQLVRDVTAAMLRKIGYQVVVTASPSEALLACERQSTPIDLLMTDVVMPGMSGPTLRDRVEALCPGIKVLFMSGYTSDVIVHHGVLEEGVNFIQKPFNTDDLAANVRRALGKR